MIAIFLAVLMGACFFAYLYVAFQLHASIRRTNEAVKDVREALAKFRRTLR